MAGIKHISAYSSSVSGAEIRNPVRYCLIFGQVAVEKRRIPAVVALKIGKTLTGSADDLVQSLSLGVLLIGKPRSTFGAAL